MAASRVQQPEARQLNSRNPGLRLTLSRRITRLAASSHAGLMALRNDDGHGSVPGMRDRWRAERSPSAKSELLKVAAMTAPNADCSDLAIVPTLRADGPADNGLRVLQVGTIRLLG
jgi:hypothetical protein